MLHRDRDFDSLATVSDWRSALYRAGARICKSELRVAGQHPFNAISHSFAVQHLDNDNEIRSEIGAIADHMSHLAAEPLHQRLLIKSHALRNLTNRSSVVFLSADGLA